MLLVVGMKLNSSVVVLSRMLISSEATRGTDIASLITIALPQLILFGRTWPAV